MDHGSSPLDVAPLLARVQALESQRAEDQLVIAEQRATIAAQQEALQTAKEQITLLKKALFSPKRERYVSSPGQGMLFETVAVETPLPATRPEPQEVPPVRSARRSRKKFAIPAFLPVVRHEHKLNDEECQCGRCGQARVIINSHTTRQIEIEPAKAHVEEHVRYTYACPKCREGGEMQTTTKPPKPLEKSPFGASVLALMIAWKFERHLPTYRQQEMFLAPLRMWLSRPLFARSLARLGERVATAGRLPLPRNSVEPRGASRRDPHSILGG